MHSFIIKIVVLVSLLYTFKTNAQTLPLTKRERTGICIKCYASNAKWYNHTTKKYYCKPCIIKYQCILQSKPKP